MCQVPRPVKPEEVITVKREVASTHHPAPAQPPLILSLSLPEQQAGGLLANAGPSAPATEAL